MSDLLYEIYLAKPEDTQIGFSSNRQRSLGLFRYAGIHSRHAKEKLKKLQRGSVKGFITDNPAIKGTESI